MSRLRLRSGLIGGSPKRSAARCWVSTEAMLGTAARTSDPTCRWVLGVCAHRPIRRFDIMGAVNSLEPATKGFESAAKTLESASKNFGLAAKSVESVGRSVLDRLGVAEDPLVGADPVAFLRSLAAVGGALAMNPAGAAAAGGRLAIGLAAAARAAGAR